MADTLTHLRVFIASPGGLEKEREAFRKALQKYNEDEAIPRGVYFEPVGWEETLSSYGRRPQSEINRNLRKVDYFLLLLHNHWGSDPGGSSEYTSGTHEEYNIACDCYEDDAVPMCDLAMLFKAVSPEQLNDPGPQLQKVLDFQEKVEEDRRHLYQRFDTTERFRDLLRSYLGAWMRQQEDGTRPQPSPPEQVEANEDPSDKYTKPSNAQLDDAWHLANEGKLTEAEVAFSKAVVGRRDPDAFLSFGYFLQRQGRLKQARMYIEQAIEAAADQENREALASAYGNLGIVLKTRGDSSGAEKMYHKSLKISEALGWREGVANAYGNLGNLLAVRSDLCGAEKVYRKALKIYERLGWHEHMSTTYGNLGNILKTRGDLDGAEGMYRKALGIDKVLGWREGVANAYSNLGNVMQTRGDLNGAEEMHRKALRIDEDLGRRKGMATHYGNLGLTLWMHGDLEGAEEMHHKALKIDEDLGRIEGMANHYGNLGLVLQARGELDGAEGMHRKALEIDEKLNNREGAARTYGDLGDILQTRGDLDGAEEMYHKALELAEQIGASLLVQQISSLLDSLEGNDPPGLSEDPDDE